MACWLWPINDFEQSITYTHQPAHNGDLRSKEHPVCWTKTLESQVKLCLLEQKPAKGVQVGLLRLDLEEHGGALRVQLVGEEIDGLTVGLLVGKDMEGCKVGNEDVGETDGPVEGTADVGTVEG